ncbi:MAG: phospho-N-acetylmuramoyl-pentapeptide-transferase [Pseudomonadota bacterium]
MLYHLLTSLQDTFSWLNVFKYQTFRSMLAFLFSFAFVLAAQPVFIRWLQNRGVKGQPIRDDGPKAHEGKRGTPTMGGMVVVAAVLLSTLLFADLSHITVWLVMMVMIGFAYLGFIDDWRKITKQDSKGLSERGKLAWQIGLGGGAAVVLALLGGSTDIFVPFLKGVTIHLGLFGFVLFTAFVLTATSNAVNFTDGLDGLAIGPVMTVACTYGVFAYLAGNAIYADYLGIHHVPGAGEIAIILASMFAAGLGFLWYNTFPAQVFMGDTGSMALGGTLGFIAVVVKQELILVVAGGVFVLEAASVVIQRYYYKATKKRVFRMAPIHHHFELLGWPEPKIIVRFWILSIVLAILALTSLKLR